MKKSTSNKMNCLKTGFFLVITTILLTSLGAQKAKEAQPRTVPAESLTTVYQTEVTELLEQGLPFPDKVLLSHWHWDHSFGAKFWNVPIISGRKTNIELEKVAKWKWDKMCLKF